MLAKINHIVKPQHELDSSSSLFLSGPPQTLGASISVFDKETQLKIYSYFFSLNITFKSSARILISFVLRFAALRF